jgi:hypothetical protein
MKAIGLVGGIKEKPNTSDEFYFWIPLWEKSLAIGSIIKVVSGNRVVFGVIDGMQSYSDARDFIFFQLSRGGDPELTPPNKEQSIIVAKGQVLKQDIDRPLIDGRVYYPSIKELGSILTFEGCNIPLGTFSNTDGNVIPVMVDEKYLLGHEGAHLNISGMSGLGTKTSAFLFILNSILTHSNSRVACIMFNIKSDDLLHINKNSDILEETDDKIYSTCNVEPSGFEARFFAPPTVLNEANSLKKDCETFRWGYHEIKEFIPDLLNAGDQDKQDKLDTAYSTLLKMADYKGVQSFSDLLDFMQEEFVGNSKLGNELVCGSYTATWKKLYNQLQGMLSRKYGALITGYQDEVLELPYQDLNHNDVWVIDLQKLGFYSRQLVFKKVISEFKSRLESKNIRVDKIILFMDELNKYAPSFHSTNVSSLKSMLIDVSARGRSIGFSLFGAEQFKSRIDSNILGNTCTDIYGKTKESELMDPIYKWISDDVKGKIKRLNKNDKLLDHELFEAPIFINLPRPPCKLGSDVISDNIGEERLILPELK